MISMENVRSRACSRAKKAGMTAAFAVPVFFLFVFLDARAGFNVLDFRPTMLFPPIPVYLADFSLCFSSRLLIGSITKLFSYQLTLPQLYTICCTMNVLALICVSLLCGAALRRIAEKKNPLLFFVLWLIVFDPVVAQECYPSIGCYDTYWIVLFSVLMLACDTSVFAVLAPFLCFAGMMVHYGFLFSFLPAVAALLFYDMLCSTKKSKRILSGCSLALTGGSSAFVLIYSFFFSKSHLTMTGEEFHSYLLSRLKLMGVEEIRLKKMFGDNLFPFNFFEVYFFDAESGTGKLDAMDAGRYLEIFYDHIKQNTSVGYYLKYAAAVLPFVLLFTVFWIACAKKAQGKGKLPFIAFAGIQTAFFAACLFSTDIYRWSASLLISQVSVLLAMIVKKDKTTEKVMSSPVFKNKKLILLFIAAGMAFAVYLFIFGAHLPRTADR